MRTTPVSTGFLPDPAAVFASALSLWLECKKHAKRQKRLCLSECHNGMDQFMREVIGIANRFEEWACSHIEFKELADVWPYLLEDRFGAACLAVTLPETLMDFDETDCLRVAIRLRLPIIFDSKLPLPVCVNVPNEVRQSAFRWFRIQTVRDALNGKNGVIYSLNDDPYDEKFGFPYFGLYGVGEDGSTEHIADRATYPEVMSLALKLAPGTNFPTTPPMYRELKK